jgi:hypothetical protein
MRPQTPEDPNPKVLFHLGGFLPFFNTDCQAKNRFFAGSQAFTLFGKGSLPGVQFFFITHRVWKGPATESDVTAR